ncbi:helix-turn-helix domain-containing protein [Peptostreptococcus equinus]|uniref:Helix-turn-helix domain-containing protein n=1 Tax=Peptostreptococcus equinus TaxID=3003601 RepID=A0ABY7JR23_9FIRM|nr:helix-turn-helix domain-containing protein [Peptostreptococcus sp. CBA3647]WAW14415.1 helix-turn-helix domain-containing protein [Peptostreptococcus sp. CBA3647]
MTSVLNLEEMKATKKILEEVIEKQEQEEFEQKGYRIVEQPTRQDLQLMTAKEVAKEYGIGENRIRELIRAGRDVSLGFPVIRMGRRALIPKGLFEEWLINACKEGLRL